MMRRCLTLLPTASSSSSSSSETLVALRTRPPPRPPRRGGDSCRALPHSYSYSDGAGRSSAGGEGQGRGEEEGHRQQHYCHVPPACPTRPAAPDTAYPTGHHIQTLTTHVPVHPPPGQPHPDPNHPRARPPSTCLLPDRQTLPIGSCKQSNNYLTNNKLTPPHLFTWAGWDFF